MLERKKKSTTEGTFTTRTRPLDLLNVFVMVHKDTNDYRDIRDKVVTNTAIEKLWNSS